MIAVFRSPAALLGVLFWVAPAPPLLANDSTAILKSGELQLTITPYIALEREDLFISMNEVRVRYRFRNTANQDVTTLVAFPLPEISVGEDAEYSVSGDDPVNFIGFQVSVNGVAITPRVQARATRFGVDQTQTFARHNISVLPFAADFYPKLEKLRGEARRELEEAGLVDWNSAFGANNIPLPNPHWRASVTFYWTQTFPAGAITEVAHHYRPVPGESFFTPEVLNDYLMQDAYCMDKAFRAAVARNFAKKRNATMRELHYVLTTGANWLGAIGDFRLIIDKGKPDNLVSLCMEGIKKTGPATFEVRRRDFIPQRNLKILILERG